MAITELGYELQWTMPDTPGGTAVVILDPRHPAHDSNMASLPLLERRILKAWLETVLESIERVTTVPVWTRDGD